MKTTKNLKMRLSRETLRTLTVEQTALAAGAIVARTRSSNDPTACFAGGPKSSIDPTAC